MELLYVQTANFTDNSAQSEQSYRKFTILHGPLHTCTEANHLSAWWPRRWHRKYSLSSHRIQIDSICRTCGHYCRYSICHKNQYTIQTFPKRCCKDYPWQFWRLLQTRFFFWQLCPRLSWRNDTDIAYLGKFWMLQLECIDVQRTAWVRSSGAFMEPLSWTFETVLLSNNEVILGHFNGTIQVGTTTYHIQRENTD